MNETRTQKLYISLQCALIAAAIGTTLLAGHPVYPGRCNVL